MKLPKWIKRLFAKWDKASLANWQERDKLRKGEASLVTPRNRGVNDDK